MSLWEIGSWGRWVPTYMRGRRGSQNGRLGNLNPEFTKGKLSFSGELTLAQLNVCTLVCSHAEDFSGLNNYLDDRKVPVVMRWLSESGCMLHIGVHVPLLLVPPFSWNMPMEKWEQPTGGLYKLINEVLILYRESVPSLPRQPVNKGRKPLTLTYAYTRPDSILLFRSCVFSVFACPSATHSLQELTNAGETANYNIILRNYYLCFNHSYHHHYTHQ